MHKLTNYFQKVPGKNTPQKRSVPEHDSLVTTPSSKKPNKGKDSNYTTPCSIKSKSFNEHNFSSPCIDTPMKPVTPYATPLQPKSKVEEKNSKEQDDTQSTTSLCYPWLQNIRDKEMRTPDDENYDPRTLYVPQKALKEMTPGQKQYWIIKADNFDVCLFFKMGKFYELFDLDAEIGAREFNLSMMSGNRPHVGFPESGFEKYAEQFVKAGYKIGRVEQTETPAELKERNKKLVGSNKDKVVNREMVSVLTQGTLVDEKLIGTPHASYLLAFVEDVEEFEYGVCYVDTSTGTFYIGEFSDDRSRTKFRTLIAQLRPKEVVYCKSNVSDITEKIVKQDLRLALVNDLSTMDELWIPGNALSHFKVFRTEIPNVIEELRFSKLALSSFGGIMSYLKRVLLDDELLSIGVFKRFDPSSEEYLSQYLVLDAHTLVNLEILETQDGDYKGSLLSIMDHCVTSFGKRLLKTWLANPLADVCLINERLDAVQDLMADSEFSSYVRSQLKSLPDLERLLSRIHSYGVGRDTKAVMYGDVDGKKMNIFLSVMNGYKKALEVIFYIRKHPLFENCSSRLKAICGHLFPNLSDLLVEYYNLFDYKKALEQGFIIPNQGFDPEYDEAVDEIRRVEKNFSDILNDFKHEFGDKSIKYVHKNKEMYQLEISENTLKSVELPDDFQHMSRRKNFQRFWNDDIKELVECLTIATDKKNNILKGLTRKVFESFCKHYSEWRRATDCIGELDCLFSLSIVSQYAEGDFSRPEFDESSEKQYISISAGRHPCIENFIPNDVFLNAGDNPASFCIVTGPNMGGKSSLLRQTCIIVIMAQVGCFVPASSCKFTVTDRIFTRIGAHDRILAGQSTFFVELEETATILHHATERSLVILDELGRGTSTFDGTAIAYAVIQYIISTIKCRTLFSTHYHMLTQEFSDNEEVSLYHMACLADKESQSVTFLYKFVKGVCSNSFGMNVAKMAGLPESVVSRAYEMSQKFEHMMKVSRAKQLYYKCKVALENNDLDSIMSLVTRSRKQVWN